ncbi:hypothetical protein [Carnobacterium divergens]|uniref:hypothetical protein n=2 Tax=Carnobacterium divergens TaxID=2748 RepID=UPI0039AF2A91
MEKKIFVLALISVSIMAGCGNESKLKDNDSQVSEQPLKKSKKETDELVSYTGLKIGDTVAVKYSKGYGGKYAFDFTLNKVEFTDQSLNGEAPAYESGFVIFNVTIKNTGKDFLEIGSLDNSNYGSILSYGKDYGFKGLDADEEIQTGESMTGEMVARYGKKGNQLTWGLEGVTTTFSYDIKADEIGDYVPE